MGHQLKHGFAVALFVGFQVFGASQAARASGPSSAEETIRAAELMRHVVVLAAPDMEGRAAGTAGEARAADYIAGEFRGIGLQPGGEAGSYFQPFDVALGTKLGRVNRLTLTAARRTNDFGPDSFSPCGFSDQGSFAGQLVFAGYGITAPELGYDDYSGIDAHGKIVLVMTHEPREGDSKSPFRRPEAFRYSELRYKAFNAREHGAKGIIVVTDPNGHPGRDELFTIRGGAGASAGIIAVKALRSVVEPILQSAGKNLAQMQKEIDASFAPRSFLIPDAVARLHVSLDKETGRAKNVIGILPGTDPKLRQQAIVIGAHYDHLGLGREHSLAPDQSGAIHPGADDNASGVAGVIALARAFARSGSRRTLVFAAFSGEEMGLLGSAAYVKNPPRPLETTFAMINMDMIGRLRDGRVYILGVDSAAEFRPLVAEALAGSALQPSYSGDAYGPSDHTSFYAAGIPVLMFFTGAHEDYHRPSDTAEKIEPEGLEKVTRLVFRTAQRLAGRPAPLTFVRTLSPGGSGRGAGSGYGAYFGSIPDFSQSEKPGVRLTGVRSAVPADTAGLKAGDVIISFAGSSIRNLDDLSLALRSTRAGDRVDFVYLRDGSEHSGSATLEERK